MKFAACIPRIIVPSYFLLFCVLHTVDSAREINRKQQEQSSYQTGGPSAKIERPFAKNLQGVYWNHTASLIGNCTTGSSLRLPWQPSNNAVCTTSYHNDNEGHLTSVITLLGKESNAHTHCNWVICPNEKQFVRVVLNLSNLVESYDNEDQSSYITICVELGKVENRMLECRKTVKPNPDQPYQEFVYAESIAVLSRMQPSHHNQILTAYIQILNYDPTCGGDYIGETSGTIESPGYPDHRLPNFFYCRYKIVVAPNERINFTVVHFTMRPDDVLCTNVKMQIRDGLDLKFPYVNIFCDDRRPPKTLLSYSNSVEISFHVLKEHHSQKEGYKISWRKVSAQELHTLNISGIRNITTLEHYARHKTIGTKQHGTASGSDNAFTGQTCGGLLMDRDGFIKLDWPYNYRANLNCTWLLHANTRRAIDNTTQHVRLSLLKMVNDQSNCSQQFLEIHEGCDFSVSKEECAGGLVFKRCVPSPKKRSRQKDIYCGLISVKDVRSFTSFSGQSITIRFFKRDKVADYRFRAYFQYLDYKPDSMCPMSNEPTGGSLTTPGYPNTFPNFFECNWEIIVPSGFRLNFIVYLHEEGIRKPDISIANFYFRDGVDSPLPLLKDLLLNRSHFLTFSSVSNHVAFYLKTGYTDIHAGVKIDWTTEQLGCNVSISSFSGIITSPGYPDHINPGTMCTWNITVTRGHAIKIAFVDVDLSTTLDEPCKNNYVMIKDGSVEEDLQFGVICTTFAVSMLTTKTNFAQIVLKVSNVHQNRRGLKFRYEAVCNIQEEGFHGVIESINYPNVYPYSITCLWKIRGTPGNVITLQFHQLRNKEMTHPWNKSHPNDFLVKQSFSVYECDKKCTMIEEDVRESSTLKVENKSVQIEFNTFNALVNVVFKLHWRIEGCVHTIRASEGTIQSRNYPRNYDNNLHCMWKITTDSGTRVQLTLHHWNIEKSKNCQSDALSIYDGSNEKSPQLILLCGEVGKLNIPKTITSRYNTMYIVFTTDAEMVFGGFHASFQQIYKSNKISCEMEREGFYGYIHSPGYPNFYPNWQNCTTKVRVHPNFRIAIKFLQFTFALQCKDFVELYESDLNLIRRLCTKPGQNQINTSFVSRDNAIIVNFQSDESMVDRGFKAIYYQTCNAILRSEFGTLATPDYMTIMMMPPGYTCNWIVEAPSIDHGIALIFFELEWAAVDELCANHLVTIFGGAEYTESTEEETIDILNSTTYYKDCCGLPPAPIISKGNVLTLEMLGIGDIQFSALYVVLTPKCMHHLREDGADLKDSWAHRACAMKVTMTVGNGFSFHITFRNVSSLYKNTTKRLCSTNFVQIFQGSYDGIYLKTICGQNIPTGIFQTSQEKYVVVYLLDEPVEQQVQKKSRLPQDMNMTRGNCADENCQRMLNIIVISSAVLIIIVVITTSIMVVWFEMRRQRRLEL